MAASNIAYVDVAPRQMFALSDEKTVLTSLPDVFLRFAVLTSPVHPDSRSDIAIWSSLEMTR